MDVVGRDTDKESPGREWGTITQGLGALRAFTHLPGSPALAGDLPLSCMRIAASTSSLA